MADRNDRAFVHPRRLAALALAIVGVFVVLSVRLRDLQVVQGAHYRELAEQDRVVCFDPAVALTQRILEAYKGAADGTAGVP